MILISIISGLMEVKHQCTDDKSADKYLKDIEKQHREYREMLGRRYANTLKTINVTASQKSKMITTFIKDCCPLKVSIINTNHNQHHLLNELK